MRGCFKRMHVAGGGVAMGHICVDVTVGELQKLLQFLFGHLQN